MRVDPEEENQSLSRTEARSPRAILSVGVPIFKLRLKRLQNVVAGEGVLIAQLHEGVPVARSGGRCDVFQVLTHCTKRERDGGHSALTRDELPSGFDLVALVGLVEESRQVRYGCVAHWRERPLQFSCGIYERICDVFQSFGSREYKAWFVSFCFVHCGTPF